MAISAFSHLPRMEEKMDVDLAYGNNTSDTTFLGVDLGWIDEHRFQASVMTFGTCALSILISLYAIYTHLAHYGRPHLQRYIVRIQLIIPVFAFASWISLNLHHESAIILGTIVWCMYG